MGRRQRFHATDIFAPLAYFRPAAMLKTGDGLFHTAMIWASMADVRKITRIYLSGMRLRHGAASLVYLRKGLRLMIFAALERESVHDSLADLRAYADSIMTMILLPADARYPPQPLPAIIGCQELCRIGKMMPMRRQNHASIRVTFIYFGEMRLDTALISRFCLPSDITRFISRLLLASRCHGARPQ